MSSRRSSQRAIAYPALPLAVKTEPVRPQTSCPGIGLKQTKTKDAPLFCAPCGVEPKRLTKDPADAGPSSPAFTLVLRKPDRDDPAKSDADLIQAHEDSESPNHDRNARIRLPHISGRDA